MSDPRPEAVPGHSEQALLGTWRLVSWQARAADSAVTYPLGEQAVGYLVYTADGRMFAQLMRPGRPGFASGDMVGGTAEKNAAAIGGYVAYSGTFEMRDAAVFHRVDLSLFPNWIGGEQRRSNPHAKRDEDLRTPDEPLDIIEAKGRDVAEALARLRDLRH